MNEEEENGEDDLSREGSLKSSPDSLRTGSGSSQTGSSSSQTSSGSPQTGTASSAPGSVENTDSEDAAKSSKEQTPKRKGRKCSQSKTDIFEGVMSKVLKTMADGLRESDRMFIQLEEKRMEMEA